MNKAEICIELATELEAYSRKWLATIRSHRLTLKRQLWAAMEYLRYAATLPTGLARVARNRINTNRKLARDIEHVLWGD